MPTRKTTLKKRSENRKKRSSKSITEYNNISKLTYLRIIIQKSMMIRQLFHARNVCKNDKNQRTHANCV